MNKTETYNKIREICAEHIPEIKELTFGAEIEREEKVFQFLYMSSYDHINKSRAYVVRDSENGIGEIWSDEDYKILGRELSLQDILRVIPYSIKCIRSSTSNGLREMIIYTGDVEYDPNIKLDLTRSIQDQEPEVLEQLLKIME